MSRIETREKACIFIYQLTFKEPDGMTYEDRKEQYVLLNPDIEEDIEFFDNLVDGVKENKSAIDEKISGYLKDWELSRLPRMDVAILEAAFYEITNMRDEIPVSVAINEAVRLAKKYGTDDSKSYINGVLSSFEKSIKS